MTNEELKKKILTIVRGAMLEADELPFIETTDNIVDALIAAGIGDVKEAERKAFVYSKEIAHLDKELQESQHRAETVEYALRKFSMRISCKNCPFSEGCDIAPDRTNDYYDCFERYIKQAEKELAEEGK